MRPPNPGEIFWSEALVARLSELWLSGTTGGEIGHRLGISRCAVMGKLRRLGMLGKPRIRLPAVRQLRSSEQLSKPRENKRPLPPPEPYQAPPPPPLPPIGSFDLLDLRNGHCRWPDGSSAPFRFCGAPQVGGSSYCSDHLARSLSGPARGVPFYLAKLGQG